MGKNYATNNMPPLHIIFAIAEHNEGVLSKEEKSKFDSIRVREKRLSNDTTSLPVFVSSWLECSRFARSEHGDRNIQIHFSSVVLVPCSNAHCI